MDLKLAGIFPISRAARAAGYAVAVRRGRCQLQTVTYNAKGTSTVRPQSGWLLPVELAAALETIGSA